MHLTTDEKFKLGMIATSLLEENKWVINLRESPEELGARLIKYGIENTKEMRLKFLENVFKTEKLYERVAAVGITKEVILKTDSNGERFDDVLINKGIAVGIGGNLRRIIKVCPENFYQGIQDIETTLQDNCNKNCRFVIWETILNITDDAPKMEILDLNISLLTRFAIIAHRNVCVPFLAMIIRYKGDHLIQKATEMQKKLLSKLIFSLNDQNIFLQGVVLKTTLIQTKEPMTDDAEKAICFENIHTVESLLSTIPCALPSIVLVCDGLPPKEVKKINQSIIPFKEKFPWAISFCFACDITDIFLETWAGKDENLVLARKAFRDSLL